MQVKSVALKKKELGAATTMSETLAGFQRYADGLVKQYLEHGLTLSPEVEDAIDTIINYIDQMYADLKSYHDDDVAAASQFENRLESCYNNTWVKDGHAQKLETLRNTIENLATIHIQCRQDLHDNCVGSMTASFDCEHWSTQTSPSLLQAAVTGEVAAGFTSTGCPATPIIPEHCEHLIDHCSVYDTYRQTNGSALLPGCARPPPGHLADEYIQANENTDELGEMEECLESMKTWLDDLYPLYECCARNEPCEFCKIQPKTCQDAQEEFEFETCLYDTEVGILCSNYDSCFDQVVSDSKADCDAIQIRANARAADNESAERIKCLLGVLKIDDNATAVHEAGTQSKADKLAECQSVEYTTYNSAWAIECPKGVVGTWEPIKQYPEGVDCMAARPDTCSDQFFEEQYRDSFEFAMEPNTCTGCVGKCEGEQLRTQVAACRQCASIIRLNESKHW